MSETKKTVKEVVDPVENQDEKVASLPSLDQYWGKDAELVTRELLSRADCTNYSSLVIVNVIDGSSRYDGAITLVLNKAIPQFVRDPETGEYVEGSSKNVFTTRIQLSAIIKTCGHDGSMQLAKAVQEAPFNRVEAILGKARISLIGRKLSAGEQFINPFASKAPATERFSEHDRMEYFPYEIQLASKETIVSNIELAKALAW